MSLTETQITRLLEPYLAGAPTPANLTTQLHTYLDLLLRWNARTNLTAIRDPEKIIQRHFGESLFAATQLAPLLAPNATLLDFGSGAGFPGLPIQLFLPELQVTLAESQGKKAAFLREAIRTLDLKTQVLAARVESLPPTRLFAAVTLRAVDNMEAALSEAGKRVSPGGLLAALGGPDLSPGPEFRQLPMPNTAGTFLYLSR